MLTGKNVLLRPITAGDLELLTEWKNDPDTFGRDYNFWPTTLERQEKLYSLDVEHEPAKFMITSQEQHEPMGLIGYGNTFSPRLYQAQEIWYQVLPRFRGKRVATQAACLLVNHLFDATPVYRIQALVVTGNQNSCRVLENAGLRQEGILRGLLFLHGRYADMHMYSIVRDDWRDEETYRQARPEF